MIDEFDRIMVRQSHHDLFIHARTSTIPNYEYTPGEWLKVYAIRYNSPNNYRLHESNWPDWME